MTSLSDINPLPTYELTLPSNNKKIKYRPYVVGEQKKLLLAHMEQKKSIALLAVKELVETCTSKSVTFANSPSFDIEYVMIKLISKSKGEIVKLGYPCNNCKNTIEFAVNLDEEISVVGGSEKTIQLSDNLYLVMKYPTVDMIEVDQVDSSTIDSGFLQIAKCVESIVYGDKVFEGKEQTPEQIKTFLDRLTEIQLQKVKTFFDNIPKLTYEKDHVCRHCKEKTTIKLEGIHHFFI